MATNIVEYVVFLTLVVANGVLAYQSFRSLNKARKLLWVHIGFGEVRFLAECCFRLLAHILAIIGFFHFHVALFALFLMIAVFISWLVDFAYSLPIRKWAWLARFLAVLLALVPHLV